MATTTHRQLGVDTFPTEKLVGALKEWWEIEIAIRQDDPFNTTPGTLYDVVVEVDSLSVVSALIIIEEVVGFRPGVTVVRRGGYRNCQEMIDHLVPAIRKQYEKRVNSRTRRKPAVYAK